MEFQPYNFNTMNESDIREEIIAPLLRHLGYRSGTENTIIREQALSYPKSFLGRKKNNDPILRGRADYICIAKGRVKWVIEAKAPDSELDKEVEEQSWSYANHAEIRAVYFCLTNGKEFRIFQTNKGPEVGAIFCCKYEEIQQSLIIIENFLSPDAILRDHPEREIDHRPPLGPGLRSLVRITNGFITFSSNTLNLQPMSGLTMSVTQGSVERNENDKLEVYMETIVPFQSLQRLNEKLGLHSLRLMSESTSLSTDSTAPSTFISTTYHVLPQGESVLNLLTWCEEPFPMNIRTRAVTAASGHLVGNIFQGKFEANLTYEEIKLTVGLTGIFYLHLA